MNTLSPYVSIITPNYNKAPFIKETIQSVLSQSYENFELIIIDDGSTDDSIQKINAFNDERIKLISLKHEPKNGGAICRNIGLKIAKGEYLMFLDSDDLLDKKCLENRVSETEKYKENDFWLFTTGTFYNNVGDSNSIWNLPQKNHLQLFLQYDLPFNIMAPIWRVPFLKKLNGFDESFPMFQDVELHTRALLQKNVKYHISSNIEADCYYRIDENRIVSDYNTYLNKWVSGTIQYINKFNSELIDYKGHYLKFLKGTLFSIINQLNYLKSINKISSDFYSEQLNRLNNQIPYKQGYFLKLYIRLYSCGLYKIKGFNFLLKYIYIHFISIAK